MQANALVSALVLVATNIRYYSLFTIHFSFEVELAKLQLFYKIFCKNNIFP